MKFVRMAMVALVVLSVSTVVSASVMDEDFESYAVGSDLHGQAGWKGWDNNAGAGAPVSDAYAYSGTQSVEIIGSADLVHEYDVEGGVWVFSAMQYIPSGGTSTSYFILLNSYDDGANQDWSEQMLFDMGTGTLSSYYVGGTTMPIVYDQWVELKFVIDLDNNTVDIYYNGAMLTSHQWDDDVHGTIGAIDLYGNNASSVYYDDIVLQSLSESQARAGEPSPADGATDVVRDVTLGWTAGTYAASHDVYFGTDAASVSTADRANPMGVLVSEGQAETGYAPADLLEYSQTYYWRVDEVNTTPDAIYTGPVWTFTTESYLYPVENIVATSNVDLTEGAGPENTINGSGLDENDLHSEMSTDMWLAAPTGADPVYIQYELDRVYKLAEMWVWNYNSEFEKVLGFGLKDVTVEYSEDGEAWTTLGDYTFAQAISEVGYAHNTTIDFAGVSARYVRLTAQSSYGPTGRYGLSEVRFLYLPVRGRLPEPSDGATGVDVNVTLDWRPGREAVSHQVSLDADAQAVTDGAAVLGTITEHQYSLEALDLGTTYYWKVDEINETLGTWEGLVWSFTTTEYLVVDDFESYNDDVDAGTTIFDTWVDGWTNETGATVGYFNAPFAEQSIVHGGRQSMPLAYDNTSAGTSEASVELDADWSLSGIKCLSLYFYGAANNTGTLYVKINDTKIAYDGPAVNIVRPSWQPWSIDLSEVAGLSNVGSLTIGIDGAGAKGIVLIDDIRLYAEVLDDSSSDITGAGDIVKGVPNDNDWPAAEYPALAIDDNVTTKYLHRKGGSMPTGFQVEPLLGSTIVTGLTLTTANDVPTRDPIAFTLSGSNASIDGPYTLIAEGDVVDFAGDTEWPRFTKTVTPIEFENTVAYKYYQIVFPTLRGSSESLMQIAEVELIGTSVE